MALVGRSLRNLDAAARDTGYLSSVPAFVSEADAGSVPDDNLLILVTGSQGESRSALARIAMDTHPNIALGRGRYGRVSAAGSFPATSGRSAPCRIISSVAASG